VGCSTAVPGRRREAGRAESTSAAQNAGKSSIASPSVAARCRPPVLERARRRATRRSPRILPLPTGGPQRLGRTRAASRAASVKYLLANGIPQQRLPRRGMGDENLALRHVQHRAGHRHRRLSRPRARSGEGSSGSTRREGRRSFAVSGGQDGAAAADHSGRSRGTSSGATRWRERSRGRGPGLPGNRSDERDRSQREASPRGHRTEPAGGGARHARVAGERAPHPSPSRAIPLSILTGHDVCTSSRPRRYGLPRIPSPRRASVHRRGSGVPSRASRVISRVITIPGAGSA